MTYRRLFFAAALTLSCFLGLIISGFRSDDVEKCWKHAPQSPVRFAQMETSRDYVAMELRCVLSNPSDQGERISFTAPIFDP